MEYRYLGKCKTLDALKSEYKRLALLLHPDRGGSTEEMAALNNEYDALAVSLPMLNSKGEEYQPREREQPADFRQAVTVAMACDGVELELCGSWLWATGNTRAHREQLKGAGYAWSANKSAWYFHSGKYRKRGKRDLSLDDIRSLYGSAPVEVQRRQALPA